MKNKSKQWNKIDDNKTAIQEDHIENGQKPTTIKMIYKFAVLFRFGHWNQNNIELSTRHERKYVAWAKETNAMWRFVEDRMCIAFLYLFIYLLTNTKKVLSYLLSKG